jgi:hypothetical protein
MDECLLGVGERTHLIIMDEEKAPILITTIRNYCAVFKERVSVFGFLKCNHVVIVIQTVKTVNEFYKYGLIKCNLGIPRE